MERHRRARAKVRGRRGSGKPDVPAIHRHRTLRGAPDFRRGSARRGDPQGAAAGEAEASEGERRTRRAFGSPGTLEGRGVERPRALRFRGVDVRALGFRARVLGPRFPPHLPGHRARPRPQNRDVNARRPRRRRAGRIGCPGWRRRPRRGAKPAPWARGAARAT